MPSPRTTMPFVLLLALLTGCGAESASYGLDAKNVEVTVGEEFTLSVPVEVTMGEDWYLTSPRPDAKVLRSTGTTEEREHQEVDGDGGGEAHFDFVAVGKGATEIRLIQCPSNACDGRDTAASPVIPKPVPSGSPTPAPRHRAKIHTYTVTVK